MERSVFIAADIHALDGESRLKEVLNLVKNDADAVQPDVFLIGGDLAGTVGGGRPRPPAGENKGGDEKSHMMRMTEEERRRWQPVFSVEDVRREIEEIFGGNISAYFTYGSHDKNEAGGAKSFFHGPASFEGFHLYGISFCEMRCADKEQMESSHYDGPDAVFGTAESGAKEFSAWVASLSDRNPVFVMSHIPLHFHRNDNRGAYIWTRALNEAAKTRDVFVFFAHNHTAEQLTALDRQYYFVPAGSPLLVQGREKDDRIDAVIGFTYLNAGYIVHGCGTLLTLSGETLTIRRYSASGNNGAFGDTGYLNPQIITLNGKS